jgi:hypothetical protein
MRKVKKHLIGEMLGEKECTLLATRRAQIEALAAEWSEIVMPAVWVRTPDSGYTLQIVPAIAEPTSHILDPFRAKSPVLLCVPILVLITELVEMSGEDVMELIPAARNIPRAGCPPNRD